MIHSFDSYNALKRRAYGAAIVTSGCGDAEAQASGFKDVFALIMSDSAHSRQATFVTLLPTILSDSERRLLLDAMARDYAGAKDWDAYLARLAQTTVA